MVIRFLFRSDALIEGIKLSAVIFGAELSAILFVIVQEFVNPAETKAELL